MEPGGSSAPSDGSTVPPSGSAAPGDEGAVPFFKKKRNKNARARPAAAADDDEPEADEAGSSVVRVTKAAKANPMVQGTTGTSSNKSMAKELAHASDVRISQYDNKATATNEQDIDRSQDAQAQYEAARAMWDDGGDVAADGSKIYRGQKAYKQYTGKSESFDGQVMNGAGPARAPVHYRATSRFDYQPDICKDYKDTGFCGYGDACKFLHDRSDYKSGWQLEKQWEEEQKAKAHALALQAFEEGEADESKGKARAVKDDGLPFACLNCREPWHAKSCPVVTKCQHYFCEACALRHAVKTKRCFVCAENTGGIFNKATAIQEKIDARTRQEEAEAAGDMSEGKYRRSALLTVLSFPLRLPAKASLPHSRPAEAIIAEYEAERKKQRGYTGGWGLV